MTKEPLKLFCNRCKVKTNHEILKEEERTDRDDEVQVNFYDCWQIIKCLGCEEISFRQLSSNSDDYDTETGEHYENIRLYPIRSDITIPIKPYYNVPPIVRNIYRETLDAYNYGLRLLCAAGLRTIIESICTHEKISDGLGEKSLKSGSSKSVRTKNLMEKINGLEEKGIITKKQAGILHEHRFLGNAALHLLEPPHKHVLSVAIEIIENILDSLYEIDEKASELVIRRKLMERRKKKSSS